MFPCPVRTAQIILFLPRRPIVLTVLFGPSILTVMYVIPSNMRSAGSSLDGDGDGDDGSVEQHWEEPEGWYSLVVQRLHQYLIPQHGTTAKAVIMNVPLFPATKAIFLE